MAYDCEEKLNKKSTFQLHKLSYKNFQEKKTMHKTCKQENNNQTHHLAYALCKFIEEFVKGK